MAILKKLYTLLLPLVLTSCYEEFTPGIDTEPLLCLNSLITAGEPIAVSVTHTWVYDQGSLTQDHSVNDATLTIFANGERVAVDYLPKAGDKIKISADSPTYGHAEAEVEVPGGVPITSLTWNAVRSYKWNDPEHSIHMFLEFLLEAEMTISDPANVENYYQLSGYYFPERNYDEDSDDEAVSFNIGTFDYDAEPIFSEHLGALDAISGNDSFGFTFFTDRSFQGKSYTLRLRFTDARFMTSIPDPTDEMLNCGIVLSINSVSRSFYNWCNYKWNAETGITGEWNDIGLSEPMWGYSNVSTGAGVVAARSTTSVTLNLKDFLKKELDEGVE